QSTGQATFDKNVTSNEQPATENQTPDPLDPFSPENSPLDISDNDLPF
ncbi:single-stranded DNA-binding protein, partial [Enterococcus faecalis]